MLQIKVIAVGKIKEKYLQMGIEEYRKRLGGYVRLEIKEIQDEPCPEKASPAEEDKIRQKEGARLLNAISDQDYVILLDMSGRNISSPELAELLAERALAGQSSITFVIGGSLGVAEEVRQRADFQWSFSRLTFPHQLIRLVLLEQIYRACKINRNEPYHK
ncbi:MAG TPA: 23S rRNA (pseudouridine(1915)-N(3))-methyltransferase RlmH [Peptococcaceae bacterium]|nr:23S rRNA (pseudouridine(1915)-N(3))-methyltransferase RlmH [Peptococcaceae bacterium]